MSNFPEKLSNFPITGNLFRFPKIFVPLLKQRVSELSTHPIPPSPKDEKMPT